MHSDFSKVSQTGGEKTHTLSVAEMPKHEGHFSYWAAREKIPDFTTVDDSTFGYYLDTNKLIADNYMRLYADRAWGVTAGNELVPRSYNLGGSEAHNNMQPYIVTYMWKRTN